MKKYSLLFAIAFLFSFGAIAQQATTQAPTAEARANNITERMDKEAQFTPSQKSQVFAINLEAAQKTDAVHAQQQAGTITQETVKLRLRTINQERETKIVALLNPEQKAKYQARKDQRLNNNNLPKEFKVKRN